MQKALHNYHPSTWEEDVPLISSCIDILESCSNVDDAAGEFKDVLSVYQGIIQAALGEQMSRSTEAGAEHDDTPLDCLFVLVPGKSDLHKAARDLLRLIHRPFGGSVSSIPEAEQREHTLQGTLVSWLEASIGPHPEWEWDPRGSNGKQYKPASRMRELLALLEFGRSLEIENLHGWH